ncbi:glycosyltransferase family 2 protein [Escherichia coli]|uniref:glycosyltransferase family 2 protein n=1 Tax=Escherichia coli TaxID=562 RepID=UPI0003EEA2CF|nr:glycosyltransferase family A protein [Escherichia coli]MCG4451410.1 glycosyltransferase family 2 protein [Escherichia coli]MCN2779160.1 glycosyltransferase family 2 protein [Escherichia coli]MCN6059277.1 glycosyltransferase family 2 protein [Escherichia coli]MDN7388243.1 glycosyltransferase family A protein [Escherichia coli]WLT67100.1 glycosyltransferase family A protein [Escherichia coli]
MSEKNVSIIIPSYNRAHILKEVIPSYFQDETLEVIVINDGSTDNTNSVLAELKEKYSQLVILENETNKKQMYSKNRGIEIAKGKYIFLVMMTLTSYPVLYLGYWLQNMRQALM